MLNSNKILNLISVILIFIIIYSIFNNTIYFNKYENFAVIPDFEDDFKDNPIYKKCPRGCGHHKSITIAKNVVKINRIMIQQH